MIPGSGAGKNPCIFAGQYRYVTQDGRQMNRDLYADVRLFPNKGAAFSSLGFILLLLSFPLYLPDYNFYLLNLMIVHAILVVGYNMLAGNTGQISLGHAGFFAIGAYGTTLLMQELGIPFIPALILAAFIAAFFGFIVGLPALKLDGPYLSIATLAFGLAIMHIIGHVEMFGGRTGIETPPLDLGIPQWGISYILVLRYTEILPVPDRCGTHDRRGQEFHGNTGREIV